MRKMSIWYSCHIWIHLSFLLNILFSYSPNIILGFPSNSFSATKSVVTSEKYSLIDRRNRKVSTNIFTSTQVLNKEHAVTSRVAVAIREANLNGTICLLFLP